MNLPCLDRISRRDLTIIICLGLLMLLPALWKHDISPALPTLPEMAPGCKADLLVGWLDCFVVFDDGTWIKKRGY